MKAKVNIILLLLLPLWLPAQGVVTPCEGWLASVDEASQKIVLSWHPSPDRYFLCYYICTGFPSIAYDSVFGRNDTTYVCQDHSPLERHTYRMYIKDSSNSASSITPPFCNMVLEASVPECATEVVASWNHYTGMPSGRAHYTLMAKYEPMDDDYREIYSTSDSVGLVHTFTLPESATRARLKVRALDDWGYCSYSNVVEVERRTVDTAAVVGIAAAAVDSAVTSVTLALSVDASYHGAPYVLYRRNNGDSWQQLAVLPDPPPAVYLDPVANPYDTLYCYLLGVKDACGLNERFSDTMCVALPDPPKPEIFFPNAVIVGDGRNGTFRPVPRGLKGDLYELDSYTRTGLLVFHSSDPAEGWTPRPDVPQGAYIYSLRCRYNSNAVEHYVGTVTVIR